MAFLNLIWMAHQANLVNHVASTWLVEFIACAQSLSDRAGFPCEGDTIDCLSNSHPPLSYEENPCLGHTIPSGRFLRGGWSVPGPKGYTLVVSASLSVVLALLWKSWTCDVVQTSEAGGLVS